MTKIKPRVEQVPTEPITIESIMYSLAFRQGVVDARAGRPPRFDGFSEGDAWQYERGRIFGVIAPRSLNVIMPNARRLNPIAIDFYRLHSGRIMDIL